MAVTAGVVLALVMLASGAVVFVAGAAPAQEGSEQLQVRSEVPVTATDLHGKPSNNSPTVAVDPSDERFAVVANRVDAPFNCALHVSGDGGRSWMPVEPLSELPEGADACYGPEVAFDAQGRLYFLFVGLAEPGSTPMGVFMVTSDDRGQTFSEPRKVLGEHGYQVRMAIDRSRGEHGRLHVVWLEARGEPSLGGLPTPPNPIMGKYSDDGGESFSEPVQVSDPGRRRVVAPALAIGADGAVHVVHYDLRDDARDYRGLDGPVWDGHWSVVAATSTDGGQTYAEHTTIDDEVVPPERVMLIFTMPPPAVAADDGGRVYAGWHDARNDDWDVFAARSVDGATTWEDPVRVNDDPKNEESTDGEPKGHDQDSTTGPHQYLPQLSVAPNGRLDAVFYDRRNSPSNLGNDVYYTHSTDQGATFAPNRKLTTLSSYSRIGPRYAVPSAQGLIEFGARLGLASEDARVLAAWTDTTKTERGAPAQDVTATTVELPQRSPLDQPPQLAGAGLALAGLLGLGVSYWGWRRTRRGAQSEGDHGT